MRGYSQLEVLESQKCSESTDIQRGQFSRQEKEEKVKQAAEKVEREKKQQL